MNKTESIMIFACARMVNKAKMAINRARVHEWKRACLVLCF